MRGTSIGIVLAVALVLKLTFVTACAYGVYRLGSATVTYLEKH